MNPFPPEHSPMSLGNLAGKIQPQPTLLARQWSALHRAAVAVSGLAGEAVRPLSPEMRDFPANIARIGGWQLSLAQHGVADLAAVMEPGLTALISVHARGAEPQAPARALLDEFNSACKAIVSLAHVEEDSV